MIRKLILGAVAALAVGFGGASATAGEPVRGPLGGPVGRPGEFAPPGRGYGSYDRDYVVLVRHYGHWDRYSRFETRYEAERAARRLEWRGYDVRVVAVEDRRRW